MELPPVTATVADVDTGARIELIPVEPGDRDTLIAKARDGVDRLNATPCP